MKWSDWWGTERGPGAGAMRVARVALLVLACALPVSIAITEASLVLGLVALLVAHLRGREWTFAPSALEAACLAMVVSWILASVVGFNPPDALFHTRKLYALGLIYLAAECLRDPRTRSRIVPLLLAGAGLTTLVGVLIYVIVTRNDPDYRLHGMMSNAMTSGGVLAASCLWAVGQVTVGSWRRRLAFGAVLVPLGLALALTQTRSHWLGFVAGTAVILLARAPRAWWTLLVGAAGFRFLAPARLLARVASIVDPHEPGNQGRISMWRSGWEIIRSRPWTGAGPQDLLSLYRAHKRPDATFESGHFHNNFVQFTVATGVIGLAAFVFWLVAGVRQLIRAVRVARDDDRALAASGLAIVTALLVAGMFDFTFGDQEVVDHTYLALGMALALLPARAKIAVESADNPRPGLTLAEREG